MGYFTKESLSFLKNLKSNNNKAWFDENRKDYEKYIKNPFKEFIAEVIFRIQEFDSDIHMEPKDAIFRINRDIRFSKDKSPYKTWISANINTSGKRTNPNSVGYYIHIDAEYIQIGGGSYHIDKYGTQAVRTSIVDNGKEIVKIMKNKNFAKLFGEIQGEKNKRIPPEFKEAFTNQPLIANKNFYYMTRYENKLALRQDFTDFVIEHHRTGNVLNEFLKSAFTGLD